MSYNDEWLIVNDDYVEIDKLKVCIKRTREKNIVFSSVTKDNSNSSNSEISYECRSCSAFFVNGLFVFFVPFKCFEKKKNSDVTFNRISFSGRFHTIWPKYSRSRGRGRLSNKFILDCLLIFRIEIRSLPLLYILGKVLFIELLFLICFAQRRPVLLWISRVYCCSIFENCYVNLVDWEKNSIFSNKQLQCHWDRQTNSNRSNWCSKTNLKDSSRLIIGKCWNF